MKGYFSRKIVYLFWLSISHLWMRQISMSVCVPLSLVNVCVVLTDDELII